MGRMLYSLTQTLARLALESAFGDSTYRWDERLAQHFAELLPERDDA